MDSEQPTIEKEQGKFSAAFTLIDAWIEKQERNRQAGRVDIELVYLTEIVSVFLSAVQSLHMMETDEAKKQALSEIEIQSKEALEGFGSISDLYEEVGVFIAAKRRLLEAHEKAKNFFLSAT